MSHAENKNWYVVHGKSQKEELAQFYLRLKGLEVFYPRLRLPECGRRKQIIPLFPNYLFVRINLNEEYYHVRWAPGVKKLVCFNDEPVPLDETIVECLRLQANPDGVLMARSNLKAGQQVFINDGPFKGLSGIIQAPPDAKGRIKVLMSLLSRDIKVEIPLQFVKSDWRPEVGRNSVEPRA